MKLYFVLLSKIFHFIQPVHLLKYGVWCLCTRLGFFPLEWRIGWHIYGVFTESPSSFCYMQIGLFPLLWMKYLLFSKFCHNHELGFWLNNIDIIHYTSDVYPHDQIWLIKEIEFLFSHVIQVTTLVQRGMPFQHLLVTWMEP